MDEYRALTNLQYAKFVFPGTFKFKVHVQCAFMFFSGLCSCRQIAVVSVMYTTSLTGLGMQVFLNTSV